MEFLLKHLKLDHLITKLGINHTGMENSNDNRVPINEKQFHNIKEELKQTNNFQKSENESDVDVMSEEEQ